MGVFNDCSEAVQDPRGDAAPHLQLVLDALAFHILTRPHYLQARFISRAVPCDKMHSRARKGIPRKNVDFADRSAAAPPSALGVA